MAVWTSPWAGGSVPSSSCSSVVLPAPLAPVIGDPLAAVEREVDVAEDARAGAVEMRDAAAAVGGLVELQADGGRLARALDPVGRRHLALEPVLARLRLLGDLLGEPLLMGRGGAGDGALGVAGLLEGAGDVGLELAAALVLGRGELLEARAPAGLLVAVGGVAAVVGGELVVQFVDAGDDGVEEAPVVGDDEHGALEARRGTARARRGRRRRGGWWARRGAGRRGPGAAWRPAARGPARRRRGARSGRAGSRWSMARRRRTSSARDSAAHAPVASARSRAWA